MLRNWERTTGLPPGSTIRILLEIAVLAFAAFILWLCLNHGFENYLKIVFTWMTVALIYSFSVIVGRSENIWVIVKAWLQKMVS